MKPFHVINIEIPPDVVICDFCNGDYSDSTEIGGVLVGSHAVCPKCAEKYSDSIREDMEDNPHMIQFAKDDETFFDFVVRIREERRVQSHRN